MAGVKPNTFPVTISNMKKKGLIEYTKETIRLTEEGRAKAHTNAEAISCADNASAQDDIIKRFKIGGKAAVLVKALFNGKIHDRETTIGSLGLKSKASAAVMLCNLKKHGIIAYDKTTVKATDLCFHLVALTTLSNTLVCGIQRSSTSGVKLLFKEDVCGWSIATEIAAKEDCTLDH